MTISENHDRLALTIARIYKTAYDCSKGWERRNAVEVLTSRLTIASKEPDVFRALGKLCRKLNIVFPEADIEDLEYLQTNTKQIMKIMSDDTGYIANLAYKYMKEMKKWKQ